MITFSSNLENSLDKYSHYDKFLLIGDFNAEDSEPILSQFLSIYNAKNIVKSKTCFKSIENPSCIDLFITNKPMSFQNTIAFCTGLSDHHRMVVTVLKASFKKNPPKTIFYRDYRKFDKNSFKSELKNLMSNKSVKSYKPFEEIFLTVLQKHAPMKSKQLRSNNAPYMTKTFRKAIMKRSELKTKYYKYKTTENCKKFKKQKNFCSRLYKKERKKYYENLDLKNVTDNKEFWKTITPFLSDKNKSSSKINLVDKNNEVISDDSELAKLLQQFFQGCSK